MFTLTLHLDLCRENEHNPYTLHSYAFRLMYVNVIIINLSYSNSYRLPPLVPAQVYLQNPLRITAKYILHRKYKFSSNQLREYLLGVNTSTRVR